MEIITAKSGGFCRGVQTAVKTAMTIPPDNTYIYGEIIHNPDVVQRIEERGIKTVEFLTEIPQNSSVIIRSHGVGKDVYRYFNENNINVIDCTCGFVRRTQQIVEREYAEKKTIVIIGEKSHPEVIGLNGWCDDSAYIFSREDEDFSILSDKNVSVVVQTTFSAKKFDKIIKIIEKVCKKKVAVFKTICYTTIERQKEAEQIAKQCDMVLVIGGLNSSNTNKLYDICKEHCSQVIRLENASLLDSKSIKNIKKLGIVTGASTPNEQTQEVLTKMAENEKDVTMEDVVAGMDSEQKKFKRGDIVKAIISDATNEGLQVLLSGAKKEILLDKEEVDCEEFSAEAYMAKLGEEVELMVIGLNPVKLSQKQIKLAKEEEALLAGVQAGEEFTVVCTGTNKGGLTAAFGTYSVFIPKSEIKVGFVKNEDLPKYVGKTLRLKAMADGIVKTDKKKEIVASQKVILVAERAAKDAEREAKEAEFFASINVDDVVEGKVERITSFGAFVSVNGFDCLAHIAELSWTPIKEVTDVLEQGQTYEFKVLKIDGVNKKVSLGYKQLQPQPWDLVGEKYAVDDVITGKVVRIAAFGAFVEVEKRIDGLVPVSQISYEWLENPTSVLTIGEEVTAKIIALDPENKKMTLSIKALQPRPEQPAREESADGEAAPRKRGGRKSQQPREVSDEMTSWREDSVGGASIADLLGQHDDE